MFLEFRNRYMLLMAFLLMQAGASLLHGQNLTLEFRRVAQQGLDSTAWGFIKPMEPTLADAQAVFKPQAAKLVTYHTGSMYRSFPDNGDRLGAEYAHIRIDSFTTEQVRSGNPAVAGGMMQNFDQLLPKVTWFRLTFLRTENAPQGLAYSYFTKVGDHWVFFPKPWEAFE
jgi:hypothetical protein